MGPCVAVAARPRPIVPVLAGEFRSVGLRPTASVGRSLRARRGPSRPASLSSGVTSRMSHDSTPHPQPSLRTSLKPALPTYAILFRIVVCLALVGAGGAVLVSLVATRPDAGRNAAKAPPPRVAVLEVAPVAIERFVRGYGTARAVGSADVPARVGAVAVALGANYAVGRPVAKDEILVELDPSDFVRQVGIARQAIRAIEAEVAVIEAQARALREAAGLAGREREIMANDLARVEAAAREGAAQAREVDLAVSYTHLTLPTKA